MESRQTLTSSLAPICRGLNRATFGLILGAVMNLQLQELAITYGITAAGMLAGLLTMRADSRAYWRWPVYSAMTMALGVVAWNLLRKHVIPHDWHDSSRMMYFCALGLYAVLGLALGLLIGRLTGRKTQESNPGDTA